MIWEIALHEWRRLRAGMMFWLLLAFGQLIIAWLAFKQLESFAKIAPQLKAGGSPLGATDLVVMPSFNSLTLLLLLGIPVLAMGSLAGEIRSGRIAVWLSSPVGSGQIALGKTLGLWLASLPLVLSVSITLAALGTGIALDWPRMALTVSGILLFSLWLCGLSLCISGLFDHPAAALAASYGILLFLWLLDSLSGPEAAWHWLALLPHTQPWLQGLLRSQDIVFFLGTGIGAVWLASYTLARRRGEI
ncbi:MAG: ABC transporter permease subunit [Chromatiaceae bacterium]|jgi:ABC-2 type transport system permease protein